MPSSALAQIPRDSAEFDLLRACCIANNSEIEVPLSQPLNWEMALKLAGHHRLLPALSWALRDREDVPVSIQSAIHARFQNHSRRVLRFSAELVRVARHFSDCGVPALAHKGPVLAQVLYGDSAMRQFGDLDLLIPARAFSKALAALGELGYEPKLHLTARQERAHLRGGYEYVFGLGGDANLLELQWQIVPRFYAIDFQMDELFARSIELQFEGVSVRTLGPEDLMLVLCAHAAKHQWAHLGMIRDIATLAQSELDWPWIIAEVKRLGVWNILCMSLLLAADFLQYKLPEVFGTECRPGNKRSLNCFEALIESGIEVNPESLQYFLSIIRLRERWQDRMRFIWRLATTSSVGEWESVQLPNYLFPLYGAVRLFRIAARFTRPARPHQ
jgi:hypothetical protein